MVKNVFISSYLAPRTQLLREWGFLALMISILMLSEFVGMAQPLRNAGEGWWHFWTLRFNTISTTVASPFIELQTLNNTQRRVRDLEAKYAQALAQVVEVEQLRQENEVLKALLTKGTSVAANRVLTTPILSYGKPLIAAGSDQGITSGMMVILSDILIGVVTDVSFNQAHVALLQQDHAPHLLAKTETGVTGIVKGNGQRVVMMEVPIEQNIVVGQRVVTQGQDGIAPNILIGTVAEVKAEPTSAVQTLIIEQIVSFYETSLLEIR